MSDENFKRNGETFGNVAAERSNPSADVEPFALAALERKTTGFLERVRTEARRAVDEARADVRTLQEDAERRFREARAAFDAERAELDERRRLLDAGEAELRRRTAELERETFDAARDAGYREGRDAGTLDGRRVGKEEAAATFAQEVEQKVEQEVAERSKAASDAALEPFRKLVREMAGVRQELLKHWEENAMQIAAAIAYQTIMRDPATIRDVPLDLLREALELATNSASLKIRMNPRDVDNLKESIRAILEECGKLATAEVVSDAKISVGGCVVESALGIVDERLESRLERIVAELSE